MNKKIDLQLAIALCFAFREHTHTRVRPDGSSENEYKDTMISFGTQDQFLCLTTVLNDTLYGFYPDAIVFKVDDSSPITDGELAELEGHLKNILNELE